MSQQEKYISSREGASLLGVDRQSFFYYATSRDISKREINDGGKEQYEYSYSDILRIKDEVQEKRANRKRSIQKQEITKTSKVKVSSATGKTDWGTREDLPYIYALDCETYGIEYSVPPTQTLQWLQKNPTAIRVLFNAENRKEIWGCLTLLPMEEKTIYEILRGDLSEQQIKQEDILTYDPGKEYVSYVASCVVRPERRSSFNLLLNSVLNYWCSHSEIHIKKLYGFAVGASENMVQENDGMRLIKKLYFSPRYDIEENAWELNLEHYNPSPIIQGFQECMQKKQEGS